MSGEDDHAHKEDSDVRLGSSGVTGLLAAAALSGAAEAASRSECAAMHAWAKAALLGETADEAAGTPGLEVRRQDHGIFGRNRSSRDTAPLQLGDKRYQHGLGTHSVSEVVVHLGKGGTRFEAEVGIDSNWDTQRRRGSVVFVVEVQDREAFRSGVCRGSDDPLSVRVDLHGATEFTLRVLDAGDGPSHDHADWADAQVTFEDGERVYLDEMPSVAASTLATDPPFSFVYDGRPSGELLPEWQRSSEKRDASGGKERYVTTYTDPATGLEVTCELTLFTEYPAADWVLHLHNKGQADTPIVENILPLDLRVTPLADDVVLHHANGSSCAPEDFQPLAADMRKGRHLALAPVGGRSSNGRLPFFNLQWGDEGLVGAIGWSGQWQLRVDRDGAGPLALQAGQQKTRLKLHPGEGIRTPRILLVRWQGGRMDGHNVVRRLIYQYYTPLLAGGKPLPPTQCNTWFPVNTGVNATERNQVELLQAYGPIGIEYLVMDAGWYGSKKGDWSGQVGTWRPRTDAFPKGLKPIGDAARKAGIQFGMWFEPERVRAGSDLDREHPEWLIKIGEAPNRLLNLGLPEGQ
nr:NPCBM/NEW2 domain-containing protein [PVC group bacterium]